LDEFVSGEDLTGLTPDCRCWGGGSFTAQKQRLIYWPLLANGDFDLGPAQFDYYRRGLPAATAPTQLCSGHEGCCFGAQLENFGLPSGWGYGWPGADPMCVREPGLDPGAEGGRWVRYYFESQLEFSHMVVQYQR